MKLFHTENGKEVVYVQRHDMAFINGHTDIPVPANIYLKFYDMGITIVDDSNRFEFVKLEEDDEVKYFKELDFIIDFNEYKNFTDEQLVEKVQKLGAKANEIAEKWNALTKEERSKNTSLLQEHRKIEYMISFLCEIYAVKHKEREMSFPEFVEIPE